jgi:hypothetical protein
MVEIGPQPSLAHTAHWLGVRGLADQVRIEDDAMRFWKFAAAFLAIACGAAAQDLAPEVLLLARIRSHMRDELSRVTNYTCLETTARFHSEHAGRSKAQSKLQPLDMVRLEVAYTNHREWFGSPGDRNFSEDNPVAFIGSGMIGNGFFAITLNNIFVSDLATFTYRGEEPLGGRTAYKFDFRLARRLGGLTVSLVGGIGTVGEQGSFWADSQSLDLIRLEYSADEIPPYLPLLEMTLNVSYARTRIGEYGVLLAQEAGLHIFKTTGEVNYNHVEYTHCRAFSAQSAIRFDSGPPGAAEPSPPERPKIVSEAGAGGAVPPFLAIALQLTAPITDRDAVGTLIEARVSGGVVRKGKIVVPDGSVVRGRIRRLERYNAAQFVVGLEFTEVEVSGGSLRFYADLIRMDRSPGIRPALTEPIIVRTTGGYQTTSQTITLHELPGVASFFVSGKTFTIPSGFRMVWRTRGLIR